MPEIPLILVIEDEKPTSKLYQNMLGLVFGFDGVDLRFAYTAEDGIHGLEEMMRQQHPPNLVITDNKMPPGKKTGMDVIDYVKANLPGTPVIMAAGESMEGTVRETARERGAADYLEKPFGIETFIGVVKKYLPGQTS